MRRDAFAASLEQEEDGRWSAWVDSLPGCAAWGNTRDEALEALKDATRAYVLDMIDADETVPQEKARTVKDFFVTVQV